MIYSKIKNYYLIIVGFSLGALFWIVDSIVHSLLSGNTIREQLFYPGPDMLYMRLFGVFLLIAFSAYTSHIITGRKLLEDELQRTIRLVREEKAKTESIIASIGDPISIQDTDFNVLYQNKIHQNIVGDQKGNYCYREYEHRDHICEGCPVNMSFKDGNIHTMERWIIKDGQKLYFEITASPLRDSTGNIIAGIEVARDITERKRADEKIAASAVKWQTTFDAINDGILIQDNEWTILQCNSAMADLLGKPVSDITGRKCWELVHGTSEPVEGCPVLRTHRTHCMENEVLPLGDRWYKVTSYPLKDNSGTLTGTVHILTDITRSKMAELEYKTILKSAMDGFYVIDSKGRILDVNDSYCSLMGYSRDELLNLNVKDIDIIDTEEIIAKRIARISNVGWGRFETSHKCKDGRIVRIEASVNYMGIGGGKFYAFMRDITERKRSEEQIKTSLAEKEVLLREIHHRVKNNMQIISSLLNLQVGSIEDKKYIEMFKESQNRIVTMSLVHEKLYMSKNFTKINFKDYIHNLANSVFQSYSSRSGKILLNLNIEDVELGIDSAIPCGLIINELVTNSIKYAFPGEKKGEIMIVFGKKDENEYELTISDNGIGFPEDLDFRKTKTLGLYLVSLLAEDQLSGKIKLDRRKGTEFCIRFGDRK